MVLGRDHCGRGIRINGFPAVTCRNLQIGQGSILNSAPSRRAKLAGRGQIDIGERCLINVGAALIAQDKIVLANDVAVADEVYVLDSNSHGLEGKATVVRPIFIDEGTWIGTRAIILPGVHIGKRCVIAAGSIVTKDVPDDTLVAGNPARPVRALTYPPGVWRAWHDEQSSFSS